MMTGGRGLEAIELNPKWVACHECHGDGFVMRDAEGWRVPCDCDTCDGTGAVEAEKSGEPEDYLEPEDPS